MISIQVSRDNRQKGGILITSAAGMKDMSRPCTETRGTSVAEVPLQRDRTGKLPDRTKRNSHQEAASQLQTRIE